MAEMLTDLLRSIYDRIAQLGKEIQGLKGSLDSLNKNIEDKMTSVSSQLEEFTQEINITQTKHIGAISEIGTAFNTELKNIQTGLGIDAFETLITNLENFSKLAEQVLNQDTVNLLLSETIDSVKALKAH